MIPIVLLGGSITVVGVLARVKGTSFGKKTPLKQKLLIEREISCISVLYTLFLNEALRRDL